MNPTKLHPSLATAITSKSHDGAPMRVIVRRRPGPVARGEVGVLSEIEPERVFKRLNALTITVDETMVSALTQDPSVDLIWPDLPVHTWLDGAVPIVRAPRVWETGFTGRGVRIAVIDTGIDPEHPDFEGRMAAYHDFLAPGDGRGSGGGREDEPRPKDPNGHGTHVAGIAAGSGVGSDGLYRGVAPEADLLIARVLDESGNGRTSEVMAGIEWALDQHAQVINVSLGGPPYPADGTDAFSVLCNAAVGEGAVVCVAAGNLGPAGHTVGSPAAAQQVITVGASVSDDLGARDDVASFSSRGPTGDGRVKPDLLFPGVSLVAPRSAGTTLGTPANDRYTALSGTSQATPVASGTAALLLQANPRLSPKEIKSRMIRGAHELAGVEDIAQGAGRGDAYNTFVAAEGEPLGDGNGDGSGRDPEPGEEPRRSGCLPSVASGLKPG